MFSYTDSVYHTNSGCHTKNVELSTPTYSSHDSAYNLEYPSQHMNTYSIQQQQWQQQQWQQQHWQEHSFPSSNSYFPSEILQQDTQQSIDRVPSYGQYYSSPTTHHTHRNSIIKHTTTTNTTTTNTTANTTTSVNHRPSYGTSLSSQGSSGSMIPSNAQSVYASNTAQSLTQNQRPRITTSLWDDEGTVCYQVDVRGICVARRQDNDMINGTKLLNVTGMSRGKRDGILKNEKGRVVVKVGAMHLKGVWVTFARAKALAVQFNIVDHLHPLFVDDPALYFYSNQLPHNYLIPNHPVYLQDSFQPTHFNHPEETKHYPSYPSLYSSNSEYPSPYQASQYTHELPAPFVPSMIPVQSQVPLYGYTSSANSPTSIQLNPY